MHNEIQGIVAILGEDNIHHKLVNERDLEDLTREGLPKKALQALAADLAEDKPVSQVIYKIVPEATYKRRSKLMSQEVSEKAIRIARLISLGSYILGSKKNAIAFFTRKHRLLDNRKPYEAALSEVGARRVEDLLWKIFYGISA